MNAIRQQISCLSQWIEALADAEVQVEAYELGLQEQLRPVLLSCVHELCVFQEVL